MTLTGAHVGLLVWLVVAGLGGAWWLVRLLWCAGLRRHLWIGHRCLVCRRLWPGFLS